MTIDTLKFSTHLDHSKHTFYFEFKEHALIHALKHLIVSHFAMGECDVSFRRHVKLPLHQICNNENESYNLIKLLFTNSK